MKELEATCAELKAKPAAAAYCERLHLKVAGLKIQLAAVKGTAVCLPDN